MWYKFATNKRMIDSMFPLGFDLGKVELSSINFTGSEVTLSLNSKNVPESFPKKWLEREFNAIRIDIELGCVLDCKYDGGQLGWFEQLRVVLGDIKSEKIMRIMTEKFSFECKYKYLTIRNIQPYEDVRW